MSCFSSEWALHRPLWASSLFAVISYFNFLETGQRMSREQSQARLTEEKYSFQFDLEISSSAYWQLNKYH